MEKSLYQKEYDFSEAETGSALPSCAAAWQAFWNDAVLKEILPRTILLPKEDLERARALFKNVWRLARNYFSTLSLALSEDGGLALTLHMGFPMEVIPESQSLGCLLRALAGCDAFEVSLVDQQRFEMLFTVKAF